MIRICYLYSADGTKLAVMLQTATTTYSRYYVGGFLYEGDGSAMELTEFSHPEGRVRVSGSTYAYDYTFRDHNHNVRAMFTIDATGNAEPIQTNSYYPFGMRFNQGPEYRTQDNDRLFGGKELQTELNLSTYDFGWRQYNPALGRWYNPDPMEEKYHSINPYNFTMNNPVNLYDPDGRDIYSLLRQVWNDTKWGEMTMWTMDDGKAQLRGRFQVVYSGGDGEGNGFVSLNLGGGNRGKFILGNGNYDQIMYSPTYLQSVANLSSAQSSGYFPGMPPPEGGVTPGRIDWNNGMAVYNGTKDWARFISKGNKPIAEYWNVFDIYKNIEPSIFKEYFSWGSMLGNISDRKTYTNGVEIFVTETRLTSNYRQNNIGGIVADEDNLRISFYGTYNQSQGVISVNFTNTAAYNEWYNYIFK